MSNELVYYKMDANPKCINYMLEQAVINKKLVEKTFGKFIIYCDYKSDYSNILTCIIGTHDIFYSIDKWNLQFPVEILELTKIQSNDKKVLTDATKQEESRKRKLYCIGRLDTCNIGGFRFTEHKDISFNYICR